MLNHWTRAVIDDLGLDLEVDRDLVLDLARDAAHRVARPAAPLTTFILGYAAGQTGADAEQLRTYADRIAELAKDWHGEGTDEGASS